MVRSLKNMFKETCFIFTILNRVYYKYIQIVFNINIIEHNIF